MTITLTVEGLDEVINRLNQQINDLPLARRAILAEGSRFLVNELKRNAHVVSGKMRDSVRTDLITESEASVIIPVPYAAIENARRGEKVGTPNTIGPYGPHNFADRAFEATQNEFRSRIKAGYDGLLG